jgi:hypothetical protein
VKPASMPEDPIKLFSSMSERYPQPGDADIVHTAARGLVSLIPVAGGPIDELLSLVLAPSVSRRRDEWLKDLADIVEELEKRIDGFKIEDLANDESFVSATIQATRIAAGTHKEEKRKMLRNALLNVALGKGPDEDTQQIFLNIVDAFTASHVRVLDVLWRGAGRMSGTLWEQNRVPMNARNYGSAIEVLVPELKGQNALVEYILTDLRSRGFTQLNGLTNNFPQGGTITNMGIQFMRFVLHPDEAP